MFACDLKMKLGHQVEYAFDVFNRDHLPFIMTEYDCEQGITICTNMGSICVTPDTMLMTPRGMWKWADQYKVGQSLKHVSGNAVIVGIYNHKNPMHMFQVCDTDYVIVEGFYINE